MMSITEFCRTDVQTVEKNSSVVDAARKMREAHVGDVVVCRKENGVSVPIGILTDRDIVVGLIALEIPFDNVTVEDIMTPALITVPKSAGIYETIHLMEAYGVRRMPVVDAHGGLFGIVSSGDLLELLSTEILSLARLPARQKIKEREIRQ
jgi:predicted transcriptional regulator